MADYTTNTTELTSIANAIRTRGKTTATLTFPSGFVSAINALPTDTIYIDIVSSATDLKDYFRNNTYITYVNLPSITQCSTTYGLAGCTNLEEVRLPNFKASGGRLFQNDTKLKTVYLDSCTTIKGYDFSGCSALQSVYLLSSTMATAESNAFSSLASGAKFYVPSSLLSSYKAATNWSKIASQIYAAP